jgi:hypothetical protein
VIGSRRVWIGVLHIALKASKKGVAQLVHAPFMITLPTAYIAARYLFMDSLGFGITLSAFLTAILIYGADIYADDGDDSDDGKQSWGLWDYLGRAIYAVFNMGILVAVLMGDIKVPIS